MTPRTFPFALRAELITCSSSCALPQHLSFFCSSHYYCFFLCQTFTNASLCIPSHFLCLSYSIYSLIASSSIEGNLQKMERQWQRKGTNRQWGSLVGSDKCHCVASTQSCRKVKRVQHRLVKSHKGKIKQREQLTGVLFSVDAASSLKLQCKKYT